MRPAGFWRRGAAWTLDAMPAAVAALALCAPLLRRTGAGLADACQGLVDAVAARMVAAILDAGSDPGVATLVLVVRGLVRDPVLLAAAAGVQSAALAFVAPLLATFVAVFLAWCVGFERSSLRATPGKRALGMRVVAADGGGAGTGTLLLRFVAGTLSWLSLNIGHMMAAMPPRHAALHDRISGTRVVLEADAPARMPAWAIAWLVAVAAAVLVAGARVSVALATAMQAALERALPG